MKDQEFKKMIGHRMNDSDGFTYPYGAAKHGEKTKKSRSASIKRQIRNDKRSVKQQIDKRIKQDEF